MIISQLVRIKQSIFERGHGPKFDGMLVEVAENLYLLGVQHRRLDYAFQVLIIGFCLVCDLIVDETVLLRKGSDNWRGFIAYTKFICVLLRALWLV